MCVMFAVIALVIYVQRTRVVIKRETIYLIYENASDEHPIEESRTI